VAEPSPAFLGRPPIVVDCSVLSAVLFQEDTSDDALRIVSGKSLHAPFLLGTELASVAVKKSRGGWPASRVEAALDKYLEQEIELHTADVHGMYSLAVRYGLSAYDAAYLWVAALLQAPLATFDAKLAKAARTHLSNPR
jgi:predicted nucleic acid-binding protein